MYSCQVTVVYNYLCGCLLISSGATGAASLGGGTGGADSTAYIIGCTILGSDQYSTDVVLINPTGSGIRINLIGNYVQARHANGTVIRLTNNASRLIGNLLLAQGSGVAVLGTGALTDVDGYYNVLDGGVDI